MRCLLVGRIPWLHSGRGSARARSANSLDGAEPCRTPITRAGSAAGHHVIAAAAAQLTWHQSQARVAAALVEKCRDDDADLTRLQIDALVPLELALIGEVDVTPQMLIQLSLLALEVQAFEDN